MPRVVAIALPKSYKAAKKEIFKNVEHRLPLGFKTLARRTNINQIVNNYHLLAVTLPMLAIAVLREPQFLGVC